MRISHALAVVITVLCLAVPLAHAQEGPPAASPPEAEPDEAEAQSEGALPPRVIQATVTGYANGADGGAVSSLTASGLRTHWGTVAADWRLYPPGTRLQIEGFS